MTKIVALTAVASIALAGCGKNDDSEKSDSKSQSICKTSTDGDGPKVGLAYDVGGRGDQSFNDAGYAGLEKAVKELGATCMEAEAGNEEADTVREERLRKMAEAGYSPIIGVGFKYSESVNKVAPDFPDTNFTVIDGFDPDTTPNENVAYSGFSEEQGSYLVGAAAAMKSKTGVIGFVGGEEGELIGRFEAGYVAGAKSVNPDIKVESQYIDQNGFDNPSAAKAAAQGMIDKKADVLFHAAGNSGTGMFEAVAAADNTWAIGVDSDQYLTASAKVKDRIITSMIKRVDTATFDAVKAVADGKPLVSYQKYDLAGEGVGYSKSGGFVDDIASDLDAIAADIKSGKITVPTKP